MAISNGANEPEKNSEEFGKVVDALHDKNKLSSLRTYQGDMAEFIKEKNESVISVAVKEKERKEEREEKKFQMGELKISPKPKQGRFKANMTMVLLSLLLIAGGFVGYLYVIQMLKTEPVSEVISETTIIPYNNSITLANVTNANFGSELSKITPGSGMSLIKTSGPDGLPIQKAKDFFDFLKISLPATLSRNLRDDFAVGMLSQNGGASPFIVITVNDFGGGFAGMLDWEENMENDLSFLENNFQIASVLIPTNNIPTVASTTSTTTPSVSTTTATTTVVAIKSPAVAPSVRIPLKQEVFIWKDIIVKNKDTRGLVNEKGKSKIAYTFLDKNTILIVGDISAIADISAIYASRSVAR